MNLAIIALGFVAACADGRPAGHRIVHRFVTDARTATARTSPATLETEWRPGFPAASDSTAFLPTATIADDGRQVLATHPSAVQRWRAPVRPDRNGHVATAAPVPAALADATALLVEVQTRAWKPSRSDWRSQPPAIVPLERAGARSVARLHTKVDPRATIADFQVVMYRPPLTEHTEHRTPPLTIPRGALLDVAFGVLEAARNVGPVTFEVAVCDDSDACEPAFAETVPPNDPRPPGWRERRVSLDAWADRRRALRFRTSDVTGHSLPVWGHPTLLASATEHATNVILISIDTLRRDHLDLYGYDRETAPFLRSLAARGTVFESLVAEASTTDPSHMTIFTSVPAVVHGVTGGLSRLRVPVTTLAEAFLAAGRRTAAFTENGPLARDRGFGLGFEVYTENKSASLLHPSGQVDRTFAQVRTWLTSHGDEPFFVFAHTFQVHEPYAPPDRYDSLFTDDGGRARAQPVRGARAAARYDREIRYVDDELAALVAWLDERHLLDDTLLVVTSDHGEEFYEHGSLGHGTLPWEQVLAVPLVMLGPGVPSGRREAGLVHHVDLMPTILALAGVPTPNGMHGHDVAAWRPGPHRPATAPLFSATWMLPSGMRAPAFSVRRGDVKLVRHRTAGRVRHALFDLAADPGERRAKTTSDTAQQLEAALDDWLAAMAADADRRRDTAVAMPAPDPAPLDPAREEKLRELGYIE